MLRGLATRLLDGYQTAAPLLTEALRQDRAQPRELDRLCRSYNLVAMELWDADTWFELASGQAQLDAPTAASAGYLSHSPTSPCSTSTPASSIMPKPCSSRRSTSTT